MLYTVERCTIYMLIYRIYYTKLLQILMHKADITNKMVKSHREEIEMNSMISICISNSMFKNMHYNVYQYWNPNKLLPQTS